MQVAYDADFTDAVGNDYGIFGLAIPEITTVQHGAIARGASFRNLTGTVDDLCVWWDQAPPLGTDVHTADSDLSVFPNPATDVVQVKSPGTQNAIAQLLDMQGRIVRSARLSELTAFNVDNLAPGVYMARILAGERVSMQRVVIQ